MDDPLSPQGDELRAVLTSSRRVAVLGASAREGRPAHDVPGYLAAAGYEIVPVNPSRVGTEMFGREVHARLSDLDDPIDIVDVFRPADRLPEHVDDVLAMRPLPKVVWFQLGIRNDDVAATLRAAGITVVQDRCMKQEHRRLARDQAAGG